MNTTPNKASRKRAEANLKVIKPEVSADIGSILDGASLSLAAGLAWIGNLRERKQLIANGICPKCFGRLKLKKAKPKQGRLRPYSICATDPRHIFFVK